MESLLRFTEQFKKLVNQQLWAKVLLGMLVGVIIGIVFSYFKNHFTPSDILLISNWFAFPGKLFIKLVQMIMIALIVSSIIIGINGSSGEQLKNVGIKSILYFLLTTFLAVLIAVIITYTIKPAKYMPPVDISIVENLKINDQSNSFELSKFPEYILNIVPDNPLDAMISGDMLSLVVFSIIIGLAILKVQTEYSNAFIKLMSGVQHICMNIIHWAMRIVPFAVMGIMASLIITTGTESIQGLGMYALTVFLALLCMLIFYLLLVFFIGKKNPFSFLYETKDALLLAFSTTSSAAVMPVSLKIAEENLKIKKNIRNIIIPLGTTINMDGTAVYQCVSYIFIAQVYGIELHIAGIILSLFTIVAASIGTPAVPGAGIIVLASVLKSSGIPAEGIITIIGIERIMGMLRASINVAGDLTACVLFNRIIR